MAKIIVLALWAAVAASFFIEFPYSDILTQFGIALALIHVVEFFIYQAQIKSKGDSAVKSFFMTIVYGIVYIKGGA